MAYTKKDIEIIKKGGIALLGVMAVFVGLVGYQLYSNHTEEKQAAPAETTVQAQPKQEEKTAPAVVKPVYYNKEISPTVADSTEQKPSNKVDVTTDADGNQHAKPNYVKPEPPKGNPPDDHESEPVETPNTPKPEDTTKPPADEQPQGGEVKDGKTYVPGFGWVDGVANGHSEPAEGMYENGNKIGIM